MNNISREIDITTLVRLITFNDASIEFIYRADTVICP